MAENKKSVLLYCDIIHTVKELSNEEAGLLFKHYLEYINDLNPTPPDKLTQIVFEPIKQNLKRDLKKWETKSKKNSDNANVRWVKQNNANACERINNDANYADKDKVIVKVKDKDINNDFLWTSVCKNFFNDFRWIEKFCINKKIKQPDLIKKMQEFIDLLELRDEYKDLSELKNHFTNHYNKNGFKASVKTENTKLPDAIELSKKYDYL